MNATAKPLPKWRRRLPLLIPTFLLLLTVGFAFSFHFYGIVGVSMAPALQDGDMVLVQTALYTPKQGDIVVFCKPSFLNDTMVKRVIAVGGQHVKIDYEAGLVYVDGAALEEPYVAEAMVDVLDPLETNLDVTVPQGAVFLMGDNRNHSSDSRDERLGPVELEYIKGKAFYILSPAERSGPVS
ncbi:MAG: signal peptidase I [Oscillospiraceae bacterium]|nr:signal peptidase I [Oscillospiraceae bacterium]